MKNFEKYKTVEERSKAFYYWWLNHGEVKPMYIHDAAFGWLDLETEEEKPLPCPFCGESVHCRQGIHDKLYMICSNSSCCYASGFRNTVEDAIAAHNRVAKAVLDAKAKEAKASGESEVVK